VHALLDRWVLTSLLAPTHNLTLIRAAFELVELDEKLRDAHPQVKKPKLPTALSSMPMPPKRKSAFLNTLSRLASPSVKLSPAKSGNGLRQVSNSSTTHSAANNSVASPTNGTSNLPSSLSSPSNELNDPFSQVMSDTDTSTLVPPSNPTITNLAAYLTSIANDQIHRQTRIWRRFVRVRTDDLESVRVERAIKRVRSDLAAHLKRPSADIPGPISISTSLSKDDGDTVIVSTSQSSPLAPEPSPTTEASQRPAGDTPSPSEAYKLTPKELTVLEHVTAEEPKPRGMPEEPKPEAPLSDSKDDDDSTPVTTDTHATRIPRSQSADPTTRNRNFIASPLSARGGTLSQTSETTEDDESSVLSESKKYIKGSRVGRKKRSYSVDPNRELKKQSKKVAIDDFEMMRVLGKGCAGKVLLVRHKPTADLFALKAITKRHVLAHQELQHTLTEQAVLKRMAAEGKDPFVVKLWWSFHDREHLFLVMDFHPGGDLATQLARWGRLGRDRARFYAAEIVEGVEGLHNNGVIYRDLKPENVLIGSDGHIVLTDFGLSKEFPRRPNGITTPSTPNGTRGDPLPNGVPSSPNSENDLVLTAGSETTTTFCGTAEYLAPEVIQGLPYSFEVDWWSFGTMLYEMLTGIVRTPPPPLWTTAC
jgi:serum/glucocorticoid-regulated kinase 2